MQASNLARTGLMRLLCRSAAESGRQEAAEAAARAGLTATGGRRAWARLHDQHANVSADDAAPEHGEFELEVPVEVAGEVCGSVGVAADDALDGVRRDRLLEVAQLLSVWEARARLASAGDHVIVGHSPGLRRVEFLIQRFAPLDEPVLIQGETGVGKELLARSVHRLSRRASRPFIAVNCAAVPDELLVSELFGHRRGSFTGAVRDQKGRMEIADGSTLFLDEVGDMGRGLQAALLRVIESGELQQLGDEARVRRVDVRLVAATNKDLVSEVAAGRFRSDLYFRLTPLSVRVPPLRDRPEDVPVLVRYFVASLERRWGRSLDLVGSAIERLAYYPFPGNVRELRNLVLRAAACADRIVQIPVPATSLALKQRTLAGGERARPADDAAGGRTASSGATIWSSSVSAAPWHASPEADGGADLSLDTATAAHLHRILALADGNVSEAARILDIPRTTLQSKLERYGLSGGKLTS